MRRVLLIIGSMVALGLPVLSAMPAAAIDIIDPACKDTSGNPLPADRLPDICKQPPSTENPLFGPNGILTKVTNILSLVVGIAAVISMIISGLRLTMSGGEPTAISSSRRGILFALIGLGIAATAQLLVRFVLGRLS